MEVKCLAIYLQWSDQYVLNIIFLQCLVNSECPINTFWINKWMNEWINKCTKWNSWRRGKRKRRERNSGSNVTSSIKPSLTLFGFCFPHPQIEGLRLVYLQGLLQLSYWKILNSLLIHSFTHYLLSIYYMRSSVLFYCDQNAQNAYLTLTF